MDKASSHHRVLLPTGRTLKPTATFYSPRRKGAIASLVDKAAVRQDVELPPNSLTKIAVILVTPSENDEFIAQFLISSQKIRALLMDTIRWYLPTSGQDEMILQWTSLEDRMHLDSINVQLPQELITVGDLAAFVPLSDARNEISETKPVVGWLTFSIAFVAVIISLYARCKDL
ncbi:hypothetical protein L226DRAFT_573142 [Lentinus tigrinus ALCF2SS1-7]|uniref:uncharacterized protein n=1 Tax=Lentinus tigrinus ALCF2SS1-7 TaxID=1328758 RepID=UPI00116617DE|nr:hypothetical protein L226DRAFT_573142 [Lentinus tigrinus ALCF2SS1-7]